MTDSDSTDGRIKYLNSIRTRIDAGEFDAETQDDATGVFIEIPDAIQSQMPERYRDACRADARNGVIVGLIIVGLLGLTALAAMGLYTLRYLLGGTR